MSNLNDKGYKEYTKRRTLSFSKDNLDLFDYLGTKDNYSAFVCELIRDHIEGEEIQNDNQELLEAIEAKEDEIQRLKGEITAYQQTINVIVSGNVGKVPSVEDENKISKDKKKNEPKTISELMDGKSNIDNILGNLK